MSRENLDRATLARIPPSTYAELRPHLRSGDVALFVGRAPISQLISRFTRSPATHVGIVVVAREIDRVLVLEAVEGFGVRMAPLSRLAWSDDPAERYDGEVVILRHRQEPTEERALMAMGWATDQLARPYSYRTLVGIGLRILFGWRNQTERGAFICSQLVAEYMARAGLPLARPPHAVTTPADLFCDPGLELLARVL